MQNTDHARRHPVPFCCKRSRLAAPCELSHTLCPAWQRLRLAMLDVSLPVMMHQHVDDLFKQIRLLWAEEASRNLVHGLFQLRQSAVISLSMVSEKGQIAKIRRYIIAGRREREKKRDKRVCAHVCGGDETNWISSSVR